jgi:hypothetical protein
MTRDARLSALHRGAAGRHASLRIQDRLENTPCMSEAANEILLMRYVVKHKM